MDLKIEKLENGKWYLELLGDGSTAPWEGKFDTEAEAMEFAIDYLSRSLADKKGVDE